MTSLSTYRGSEFLASGISHDLLRFVKKVSEAKSKAEERGHVQTELELVKARIGLPDVSSSKMKEYLIRLIHCHMMGYNVDFGLIFAIMSTQSGESVADRRVGYIASTLFIENDSELTIMLTNTLQRDLQSASFQDRCAALIAICNIRHPEINLSVVDMVIANTDYQKETVRKKAYVALYSLYEVDQQLQDQVIPVLEKGLVDKDPSVLGAVIAVWKRLIEKTPSLYEDVLPAVVSHLRYIITGKLHKSFDYHSTPSPWVQLHCLEILEIVQRAGLGSPSDTLTVVMEVLRAAEKGVDASFAIIYQCVRVLSALPTQYVTELIEQGQQPFRAVQKFVSAQNHILKYLGLRCLTFMNDDFWDESWRDGTIISEAIAVSCGDSTLADEAMKLIERIANSDIIYNIHENCLKPMSDSSLQGTAFHEKLCNWYAKQIEDHCNETDGYLELMLQVVIESGKSLPEQYIDSYCGRFGAAIYDDIDNTQFRTKAVEIFYKLLKRKSSMTIPKPLLKIAFKTLGENTHISGQEPIEIINQLEKWLSIVKDDDDLIVFNVIVLHDCVARERLCPSSLIELVKTYRRSPVLEVQEACYQFLKFVETLDYNQIIDTHPDYQHWDKPIMANRNRPNNNRYLSNQFEVTSKHSPALGYKNYSPSRRSSSTHSMDEPDEQVHTPYQQRSSAYHTPSSPSYSHRSSQDRSASRSLRSTHSTNTHKRQDDLLKSLIDLELSSDDSYSARVSESALPLKPLRINTSQFGNLWVSFPQHEIKFKPAHVFVTTMEKIAETAEVDIGLCAIEIIGIELIAAGELGSRRPVLAHLRIDEEGDVVCTVRATTQHDSVAFRHIIDQRLI